MQIRQNAVRSRGLSLFCAFLELVMLRRTDGELRYCSSADGLLFGGLRKADGNGAEALEQPQGLFEPREVFGDVDGGGEHRE
jgi:hypothetical protein